MKKFLTFVLVLAMVLSVSSFAMAATTLPTAVDGVIILTEDTYELGAAFEVTNGQDITIDLNGKSITPSSSIAVDSLIIVHHGGKLTIKDSAGNGMIDSGNLCAIKMTVKQDNQNPPEAELVIESGTVKSENYFAITGNGSITSDNYRANTKITINGGSVISTQTCAIYHPQAGKLTISGGTVSGHESGIAIKSGTLNITGGKVECTGPDSSPTAGYSNGVNASGAAIQIESNKDYAGDVKVNISGGSVESANGASIYEYTYTNDSSAQNYDSSKRASTGDNTEVAEIKVTGGNVKGKIRISDKLDNKDKTNTDTIAISGGTFTEDPSAYLESDAVAASINEGGTNSYAVGKESIQKKVKDMVDSGKNPEDITVTVTNGKVNFNTGDLPGKVKITDNNNTGSVTVNNQPVSSAPVAMPTPVPEKPASTGSGYSGPDVWYIGGNTFGTNTNQVPTSVEIDQVPVYFTMNGSQITVDCITPGAKWVKVSWGSTTNTRYFTPDANAYCAQAVIPKTGGMSIWAAIAEFFGF